MLPDYRKEILDLPRAVRDTLEQGRANYDALVRGTRWGELPIYFVAWGRSLPVAHFAACVFETLLDWPCLVRTPADFTAYSAPGIRPRNIVFLISDGQDSPEALEAAKATRARHGIVLALAAQPEEPLAQAADGALLVRAGEEHGGVRLPVCQQVAVGLMALLAARALKRRRPQYDSLEEEYSKLPDHAAWAFSQLTEGVIALASELTRARTLTLLAGGCYFPTAIAAGGLLKRLAGVRVETLNATEAQPARFGRDEIILVLSGSRCRVKKQIHSVVEVAKRAGTNILSLTDANDPEVTRRSALSLHLPPLHEITGATLAHAVLAWLAYHAARSAARKA